MEDDFLVTLEDYKAVRKGKTGEYCMPGLEAWARRNGLSYRAMLRDGVKASVLQGIRDPYVSKVLEAARKRVEMEGGNVVP